MNKLIGLLLCAAAVGTFVLVFDYLTTLNDFTFGALMVIGAVLALIGIDYFKE